MFNIPAAVTAITALVNKFVPDRDAQIKLQAEIETKLIEYQHQQLNNQAEINKVEAASPSFFVAGWRPACGWCGALGLLWQFFLAPIITWAATLSGSKVTLPVIPSEELFQLVLALLGLAGWRTLDKIKNVATTAVKK